MSPCDPFALLPQVPGLTLTSANLRDGNQLPTAQRSGVFGVPGGQDLSPQLSWTGAPESTRSFAVTMYDPDAVTGSGFWHWAVANLPAGTTTLPEGAGDDTGSGLPSPAIQLPNDARAARFLGGAPPAGGGLHRYHVTVYALDVDDIGVAPDATPAFLGFLMAGHTVARASIVAPSGTP